MTSNSPDFNILKGPQDSFLSVLPAFASIRDLALPVTEEKAGPLKYYTIVPHPEGGRAFLPAFTEESAAPPPFVKHPVLEAALLFFHAPRHDLFIFNPGGASSLKASRSDISVLAGFLQAGGNKPQDSLSTAGREFSMGSLHKAHYYYALAAAEKQTPAARIALCAPLIELGLYQEAYDLLKSEREPEALLLLATVHRRTGNPQRAAEALAAIPRGTPLEDRKAVETAWLDLEAGRDEDAEKAFERFSVSAFDKTEALAGLGATRAKMAFRAKDPRRLAAATSALRSALAMPSHAAARIFFQLGNIYFRSGDSSQAEDCYRKAAALSPGLQALANLAATLIRAGKHQEAAVIAAKVALTDPASARRLADQLPKEGAPQAGQPRFGQGANTGMGGHTDAPTQPKEFDLEALRTAPPQARAAARQAPPEPAGRKSGFEMETLQDAMGTPAAPAAPSRSREPEAGVSGRMNALNLETLQGTLAAPSAEQGQASLEPAAPRIPPGISNRRTFSQDQGADMQSLQEAMRSPSSQDGQERRPEEFLSGAYKLASDLEREFGGKVHFNREGLTAVEKKLRICAKQGKFSSAPELIKDCSAFLCYFLQERHKGRLVKLADCEPWAWPMIFKQQDATVTTYPVQRVWRLLWDENLPEPGWLAKYADWLAGSLSSAAGRPTGADAVRSGTKSHPERLIDTQTEHKRIMKLVSTLAETSDIELGRPGVAKLAAAIRNNFKPDIPPSADGWKLLRCFGHILAATLAKDFKADWYNTDGEDGRWSMQLPWGAFVFPIGKIYKTASQREDLGDYYAAMLSEWLKRQPKNQ